MMIQKNKINQEDKKALQMQMYLQYFKKIFLSPEQHMTNNPLLQSLGFEEEAIKEMRSRFQQILGVTNNYNQIFRSEHKWYNYRKDFDDIVEGELNALLQVMAEKATGIKNIDLGQKIQGSESAIVDIDTLSKELIDKLVQNCGNSINSVQSTEIIEGIKAVARSQKVDNTGYSKDLVISAKINSKFQNFIDLFSDVTFSVKNYKGNLDYNIHLGSTNAFKAMYGALRSLDIPPAEAVHIYSHSNMSYKLRPHNIDRNNDIFHLRFMYELMGSGLIDPQSKKPLKEVDFLIYNDPTSDKIFVKSTKSLIADILDDKYMKITNPWKGIYIAKQKFN